MKRLSENPLLRHLAQFIGTIVIVAGFTWTIAKPHAEDFIKRTLKPEILDLTESVETLQAIQQARTDENRRWQAETQTKIVYIEKLAKEQRDMSARILFEIRR